MPKSEIIIISVAYLPSNLIESGLLLVDDVIHPPEAAAIQQLDGVNGSQEVYNCVEEEGVYEYDPTTDGYAKKSSSIREMQEIWIDDI